jgi:L-threonylcarbamoyladenylate synthase
VKVNPWHIKLAVRTVQAGGIIAYPTEAVFGLGCAPHDARAVRRILALKRRPVYKGLILVAADAAQIRPLVDLGRVPEPDRILAGWPGPVTWILPSRPGVPDWLTGGRPNLAVRVSAHPAVRQLCLGCGPLVSTSANPEGTEPARTPERVRAYFGPGLDYILPGATGGAAAPSEIRDALSGRVLRRGA